MRASNIQRLPKSKAVAFLVRTYITPLVELKDEPQSLRELLGAMEALARDMASYKGKQVWGDLVEAYCKETLKMYGLAGVDGAGHPEVMNEETRKEKMHDTGITVKI